MAKLTLRHLETQVQGHLVQCGQWPALNGSCQHPGVGLEPVSLAGEEGCGAPKENSY